MKKFLLLSTALICSIFGLVAQGTMTLQTAAEQGTKARILLNATSATSPISIDWGNGVKIDYTVDPSVAAYNRWIDGAIAGSNIIIEGNLTEATIEELNITGVQITGMSNLTSLSLKKNQITSFELLSTTPLKTLNLSYNNLANSTGADKTLSLEWAGKTLTDLNVSYNTDLVCLDISSLTNLNYLTANDCPKFGSIFVCLPEESRTTIRNINLSNCDLAHFYPVSLPALTSLNLANNKLMTSADNDAFYLGTNYPALKYLDISNNALIDDIDITGCTKLESFTASNNRLTSITTSQCPELTSLVVANNKISSFDLGNNSKLTTINVAGNPIKELDLTQFPSLYTLDISNTQISRVDLLEAYFLSSFKAANTQLEFVDFNGLQAGRCSMIDLRDNSRMTSETVSYTIKTLPVAKTYYGGNNLLLSGSNAEHACTDYAISTDMNWKCDVTGDGTATHNSVAVTLNGATDTGENISGHLDRLYSHMGMGLDYDLDVYQTSGGKFLLAQWQPEYFQSIKSVAGSALTGVPMYVKAYPEDGKRFKSVTVNGVDITSPWFVISGPSTITVNFTGAENSLSMTTTPGTAMSFIVNTTTNNGKVSVDWGTGTRTEYTGQNKYSTTSEIKGTRIDGSAAGSTVTIYGDIAALDAAGYGDAAEYFGLWDNKITAVDISACPGLKYLSLYWNPIKSIDLSTATDLEVLDVAYTDLKSLDVSKCPNLVWLEAYSDGFGDDGISQLTAIDVSANKYLQYLDVKGNLITSLNVKNNPYLYWLFAGNNKISSIDLSNCPDMEILRIQNNKLTSLDLTKNPLLIEVNAEGNSLSSINLKNNTLLSELSLANNDIHSLDLSANTQLTRLYINGNGMTAAELNDVYYLLPQHTETASDSASTSWNLALVQGTDKKENAAVSSDTSIAIYKGWTPSHKGNNVGSETAYLDITTSAHGTATVTDADGKVYTHGSKVPKYTMLTINATPDEGYKMLAFSLNGEEAQSGDSFKMPGIYTRLNVQFIKDAGVDNVDADAIVINGTRGAITISGTDAQAAVFAINGAKVYEGSKRTIDLAPGMYIVRCAGHTVKVMVM
jgi:Leucine-rich repeat (LRR) protein